MEVLSGIEDMGRAVLEQIVVVLCMPVPCCCEGEAGIGSIRHPNVRYHHKLFSRSEHWADIS